MKTVLKIALVLSWFDLVIAGILVIIGLLMALATPSLPAFTSVVLASSIILHSYAALQLRKSILYPQHQLTRNTAAGLRFMGLMAFFYAVLNAGYAISIMQHTKDFIQQMKLPAGAENLPVTTIVRIGIGFSLLFCVAIVANVVLNLRLLALWYKSQEPKS